jgi:hypothetical protein
MVTVPLIRGRGETEHTNETILFSSFGGLAEAFLVRGRESQKGVEEGPEEICPG